MKLFGRIKKTTERVDGCKWLCLFVKIKEKKFKRKYKIWLIHQLPTEKCPREEIENKNKLLKKKENWPSSSLLLLLFATKCSWPKGIFFFLVVAFVLYSLVRRPRESKSEKQSTSKRLGTLEKTKKTVDEMSSHVGEWSFFFLGAFPPVAGGPTWNNTHARKKKKRKNTLMHYQTTPTHTHRVWPGRETPALKWSTGKKNVCVLFKQTREVCEKSVTQGSKRNQRPNAMTCRSQLTCSSQPHREPAVSLLRAKASCVALSRLLDCSPMQNKAIKV